jgi:two-component system, OmpR family, sensor histidine kinase RstB
MSRLFWKLWLSAIGAFVAVLAVHELLLVLVFYSDEELAYVERELGRGARLAAESLAQVDLKDRSVELANIAEILDLECELVSASEIDPELLQRIATGAAALEVIGLRSANLLVAVPGTDLYLRTGPIYDPPARFTMRHLALLILAGAVFSLFLWWRIRPLRRQHQELENVALALSSGERDQRVDLSKVREVDDLGRAFNFMAEKTQARYDAQQRLLRSVSHELRTPISRMRIAAHLLREIQDDQQREQSIDALDQDFDQLNDLVEELLTYARFEGDAAPLELSNVNVMELLTEFKDQFADDFQSIEIKSTKESVAAQLAPKFFHRAVSNLIRNSLNAGATQLQINLTTKPLSVEIHDNGPGIPMESREIVFEPFHRLADALSNSEQDAPSTPSGHGLGLAIVQQIVKWHNGKVSIHKSSKLGGCCVRTTWG